MLGSYSTRNNNKNSDKNISSARFFKKLSTTDENEKNIVNYIDRLMPQTQKNINLHSNNTIGNSNSHGVLALQSHNHNNINNINNGNSSSSSHFNNSGNSVLNMIKSSSNKKLSRKKSVNNITSMSGKALKTLNSVGSLS